MSGEFCRFVGKYKDYFQAVSVVNEFVDQKKNILNETGHPLINGYCLNPVIEFTRKGNRRIVYRVFVKKRPEEYTEEDKIRMRRLGKTFRGLYIDYIYA